MYIVLLFLPGKSHDNAMHKKGADVFCDRRHYSHQDGIDGLLNRVRRWSLMRDIMEQSIYS